MPPRRIIPTLITDLAPLIGNIPQHQGTEAQNKHWNNILAIEQKYIKPSKSKKSHVGHGTHHEHLNSWPSYVLHYCEMKKINKDQSIYALLKKNYDKGRYYSSKTKRFRNYK